MLDRIVGRIQLTAEQYDRAVKLYKDIGRWLSESDSPLRQYDPDIFPQGSMLLRTTVKPFRDDGEEVEFDIDLVCLLQVDPGTLHAGQLYALIEKRLRNHKDYGKLVEPKGRCLRISFPKELLHLDVIPAAPNDELSTIGGILIPDKKTWKGQQDARSSYKQTDPLGYAAWFETRCFLARGMTMAEAKALIAPVPPREPVHQKPPLRKIVQLIKHRRNQAFLGASEIPSSILISTMAAYAYTGQADLSRGLFDVLRGMEAALANAGPRRVVVSNPTNGEEDFASAMSQACYDKFVRMISTMAGEVAEALRSDTQRRVFEPKLAKFGGQGVVAKAYNDLVNETTGARDEGRLTAGAGGALSIGSAAFGSQTGKRVPGNTFHLNG
jgi:hypothetical protein